MRIYDVTRKYDVTRIYDVSRIYDVTRIFNVRNKSRYLKVQNFAAVEFLQKKVFFRKRY